MSGVDCGSLINLQLTQRIKFQGVVLSSNQLIEINLYTNKALKGTASTYSFEEKNRRMAYIFTFKY